MSLFLKSVLLNIKINIFYQKILLSLVLIFYSIHLIAQNSLSITIYDENSQPVSGAKLSLNNSKLSITNDEGKYIFTEITAEVFEIKISANGYDEEIIRGRLNQQNNFDIFLKPKVTELKEVEIRGNAAEKIRKTESSNIEYLRKAYLEDVKASNLIQSLNCIPGINSMDIGTGISKPMIRGLGYYRVVIANNGIKYEGQQWSNHHGISIDQNAIENIEIIKGPSCLQFGSDAIGGAINILNPDILEENGLKGEISLSAKSNTKWIGSSAILKFRDEDFFSILDISFSNFGDFSVPETDSFLLPAPVSASQASHKVILGKKMLNTSGNEKNISIHTGLVKSWGKFTIDFSYNQNKIGFFDWQGLQNDSIRTNHLKNFRDIQLPYQFTDNFSIFSTNSIFQKKGKTEFNFGYQLNRSKEFSFLTDRTGNRAQDLRIFQSLGNYELGLFLHTFSANVISTYNLNSNHIFKIGINNQFQNHTTEGYSHILPKYSRFSTGIYTIYKYFISSKINTNIGARFDLYNFKMKESINPDPEFGDSIFNLKFSKIFYAKSFSIGLNYILNDSSILKCNIGTGFRVPSAYELGAYGLHRHEGRFEKGNINNAPEQSLQFDIGFEKSWNYINFKVSPFVNYFYNYLYLNPTPQLRPEGQVYEYRQTKALMTGGEANFEFLLKKRIKVTVGAEYVYAVNLDLSSALPFTPPFDIRTAIIYQPKDYKHFRNNKISLELVSVAQQNYTVPNELRTDGHNILNLSSKSDAVLGSKKVSILLKFNNLLNTKYFNHISFYRRLRIPEPGRDIHITLSIPFNK